MRTAGEPLNFASLVAPASDYRLGPGDVLDVTVVDLVREGDADPITVQVLENGEIQLPRLGAVDVSDLTASEAQRAITDALLNQGLLIDPSAVVALVQKGTIDIVVLGAVEEPGIKTLPRDQADVGHALAAAAGFAEEAGDVIEVHRKAPPFGMLPLQPQDGVIPPAPVNPTPAPLPIEPPPVAPLPIEPPPVARSVTRARTIKQMATPSGTAQRQKQEPAISMVGHADLVQIEPHTNYRSRSTASPIQLAGHVTTDVVEPSLPPLESSTVEMDHSYGPTGMVYAEAPPITRIPLRGAIPEELAMIDTSLRAGDVIVVPPKTAEVFYVVGRLSETSRVRFTVNDRDREIGSGFLLPRDREIDTVTAVAMAGYIDPINSPTTVTVHRRQFDGTPLLIRVDLIKARRDPKENVLIQPGDIVYLNPDHHWYGRYLFDQLIDRGLGAGLGTAFGVWLTD